MCKLIQLKQISIGNQLPIQFYTGNLKKMQMTILESEEMQVIQMQHTQKFDEFDQFQVSQPIQRIYIEIEQKSQA